MLYFSNFWIIQSKSRESFEKLVKALKTRYEYCDVDAYDCFDRINGLDVSFLLEKCIYHTECYQNIIHSKNLERLVKRQKINPNTPGNESNGSVEQPIDTKTPVQDEAPRLLRSKSQPYFNELCIICQQQGGNLHKVETIHIGQKEAEGCKRTTRSVVLSSDEQYF